MQFKIIFNFLFWFGLNRTMSGKNISKQLTLDLIVSKTKSSNLQTIKNLNLWGNQLEDLALLQKMPNLEVISLSVNKISSLRDFAKCYKLQELYLRKNNIEDIRQIKHLMNLPNLKVLWLHDNPCSQIQNYRQIVIKHLPYIMKLDNNPVEQEQRLAAQSLPYSFQTQEKQDIKRDKNKSQSNFNQKKQKTPNFEQKEQPAVYNKRQRDMNSNKNILMAVLSLMRQLDSKSLEIIKQEAEDLMK